MPHPDPAGRAVDDPDPVPSIAEARHRRPTWRRGATVVLGDGACWWLPPVDLGLILTCPRFRRDANAALKILDTFAGVAESDPAANVRCALYHAKMARIGVTLLRENYEVPDEAWPRLVAFPALAQALRFTGAVAGVFADAMPAWSTLLVGGRLPS